MPADWNVNIENPRVDIQPQNGETYIQAFSPFIHEENNLTTSFFAKNFVWIPTEKKKL